MKIKVISLNLYEGGLLFQQILDFFEQENPDILLLQEVNNGQNDQLPNHLRSMQVLSQALPNFHSFFSPEILLNRPEGKIDIGNAIFSRFPLRNQNTVFLNVEYGTYDPVPIGGDFSNHPKNLQTCEVALRNKNLTVGNLHGIWGLDGGDNPARLKMSQLIIEEIKNKETIILGGDFNLKPNTKTIKNIENHLTNVFKDDLKNTFNLKRKDLKKFPGYATAVVDMVFVSQNLKAVNKNCPKIDISDHLPLIVELEI